MNRKKIELYVGLFVLIGLFSVGYLVLVIGEFSFFQNNHYSIHGYFSSASGLKPGARVEIAGVEVGTVANIEIDTERLVAKVILHIQKNIEISEDSIASVKTSGIIGQKYIAVSPGGDDMMLEDGDEIYNTESTLDIESLIRKLIFSNDTTP